MRLVSRACTITAQIDGDGIDNDCDGTADEELCNGVDDDADGAVDEDCGGMHRYFSYCLTSHSKFFYYIYGFICSPCSWSVIWYIILPDLHGEYS